MSWSRSTQDDLVKIIDKRHDSDDRKYYDTVENAAHDLSEYHKGEQAIQAAENLNELAAEVDQFRAAVGQPDTQQQTPQAEQPQPDADPQPEFGEHPPSGLSPKLQAALADPELRAAYEAPYQAAAQVQQAYNAAAAANCGRCFSSRCSPLSPSSPAIQRSTAADGAGTFQPANPQRKPRLKNICSTSSAVYSGRATGQGG